MPQRSWSKLYCYFKNKIFSQKGLGMLIQSTTDGMAETSPQTYLWTNLLYTPSNFPAVQSSVLMLIHS